MSKHAEPHPMLHRYYLNEAILTPHEAINLASKLLQFATQAGNK